MGMGSYFLTFSKPTNKKITLLKDVPDLTAEKILSIVHETTQEVVFR